MPGLAAAEQDAVSLVRCIARALNRRISEEYALIRLPKNSTVGDVVRDIKSKIFVPSENIGNINDQY
ncbi:hypothetical protein ZWY2020_028549 [Hordeum vulgare]|nr:hypothetical protein ZWY2020_028549 [Hordeum vulgare]